MDCLNCGHSDDSHNDTSYDGVGVRVLQSECYCGCEALVVKTPFKFSFKDIPAPKCYITGDAYDALVAAFEEED